MATKNFIDKESLQTLVNQVNENSELLNSKVEYANEVVNNDVSYVKTMPNDVGEYAAVAKVGGMTYKDGDTLKNAKVTEIESVGANVSPITEPQSGYFYDTSGWQSGANASFICFFATDVKENTTYSAQSNLVINSIWFDDGVNPIERCTGRRAFTTPTGCKRLRVTVRNTSGAADTSAFKWFMINYGNEVKAYVPYSGKHTLPIPEAVQALDGYGEGVNESVYNYIDWEKKQFVKRVEKIVIDGTKIKVNSVSRHTNDFYYAVVLLSSVGIDSDKNAINSHFKVGLLVEPGYCYITARGKYLVMINNDQGLISPDLWNAWLEEHPVTFVYKLATPEVTDISDILPADNLLEVEGGGTITFKNEYEYDVPSEISYALGDSSKIIVADTFIGDLQGKASQAERVEWEGVINKPDVPTKISDLENDTNFITIDEVNTKIAALEARITFLEDKLLTLDAPVIEIEVEEGAVSGYTLTIESYGEWDFGNYGLYINGESQSVGTGTWENVSTVGFNDDAGMDSITIDVESGTFPTVISINNTTITLVDDVVISNIYK